MKTNRVSKQVHRKSKALEHPGNYSREIYRITCSLSAIKSDNKMTKLKDDGMIRQSSISLNQHRNLQCFIHSESFWSEVLAMESEVCKLLCTRFSGHCFIHGCDFLSLKFPMRYRISRSLMTFMKM